MLGLVCATRAVGWRQKFGGIAGSGSSAGIITVMMMSLTKKLFWISDLV